MQVCPLENRLYSGKEPVSNTRQLIAFKACHLLRSYSYQDRMFPLDHATPPFQICAFVQNQVNCLSVEFSIRRRKLLYSVLIFQSFLQLSLQDTSRSHSHHCSSLSYAGLAPLWIHSTASSCRYKWDLVTVKMLTDEDPRGYYLLHFQCQILVPYFRIFALRRDETNQS